MKCDDCPNHSLHGVRCAGNVSWIHNMFRMRDARSFVPVSLVETPARNIDSRTPSSCRPRQTTQLGPPRLCSHVLSCALSRGDIECQRPCGTAWHCAHSAVLLSLCAHPPMHNFARSSVNTRDDMEALTKLRDIKMRFGWRRDEAPPAGVKARQLVAMTSPVMRMTRR